MADNPQDSKSGPLPPLPSSGMEGRAKAPTTLLPPVKKPGPGKIVVMLSSVAKPPPAGTQSLPSVTPPDTSAPVKSPSLASPPITTAPATTPPITSPPKVEQIASSSQVVKRPPPLPPKDVSPALPISQSASRLSTTTYVKLPPKTANPSIVTLSGKPVAVPEPTPVPPPAKAEPASKATPPPLPPKRPSPLSRKTAPIVIQPIHLDEPTAGDDSSEDSIFAPADKSTPAPKPEGWKNLEPGELPRPAGSLKNLDVFERSQRLERPPAVAKPIAATPTSPLVPPTPVPSATPSETSPSPKPEAKEKAAPPLVAPALKPPARTERIELPTPTLNPPPVPSTLPKPDEVPTAPAVNVAPPMLEKAAEPPAEKLPQPLLHTQPVPSALPPSLGVTKVPALIPPQSTLKKHTQSLAKLADEWLKKTAPIVLPSPAPISPTPPAESKPALKAPVLPRRTQLKEADAETLPPESQPPAVIEAKETSKKIDEPPPIAKPPEIVPVPAAKSPDTEAPPVVEKEKPAPVIAPVISAVAPVAALVTPIAAQVTPPVTPTAAPVSPLSVKLPERDKSTPTSVQKVKATTDKAPATPAASVPNPSTTKAPLPKTRAERAKKRRFMETVLFWAVIVPVTVIGLVFATLHFGRDTRVEGQIIPPPGMTLNNEVWIVTDFSSLASGIAEDLAAERTPIMQEIQERQEHVQRAQADIASREERIRLIQEQISTAKDEIAAIVKQSRDETQHIWDTEGAEIDNEYEAKVAQLKSAIADRAKSLHLNYQPDENFQSPEVWANAYRLALYEVPPGVDSVKEHQWLSDQMKQWRDLQKSLDSRKEALREKAAQVKLEPAPKIADLNAKIEDLQQRIDSTTSEEDPLKAELQQAQADLVLAQAADANLDDKYYKQLYTLPEGSIVNHRRFPLNTNGRFTWVEDEPFVEGEDQHHYWIFSGPRVLMAGNTGRSTTSASARTKPWN